MNTVHDRKSNDNQDLLSQLLARLRALRQDILFGLRTAQWHDPDNVILCSIKFQSVSHYSHMAWYNSENSEHQHVLLDFSFPSLFSTGQERNRILHDYENKINERLSTLHYCLSN